MSQFSYFHDSFKAEQIKNIGKLNLIKNKLLDLDFIKSINDRKNKPEILNDLIYKKVLFVLAESYKQSLVYSYPPSSRPNNIDSAIDELNTLANSVFDSTFAYKVIKIDDLDINVVVMDLELFYTDMLLQEQEEMICKQPLSNVSDIKLLARKISSSIEFIIRTTKYKKYFEAEFVNFRLGLNTGYLNYFFNKTQTEHIFGVVNNPALDINLVGTKNHKDIKGEVIYNGDRTLYE